jgi:hydroxyethylthiazole kinase
MQSISDLSTQALISRDLVAALRRDAPLVQCLTNFVSMNTAAKRKRPSSRASAARS